MWLKVQAGLLNTGVPVRAFMLKLAVEGWVTRPERSKRLCNPVLKSHPAVTRRDHSAGSITLLAQDIMHASPRGENLAA